MKDQPHDVEHLRELPQIPFSEALHDRILHVVQNQDATTARGARRFRRRWNLLIAAGGMLAAAMAIVAVLSTNVASPPRPNAVSHTDFATNSNPNGLPSEDSLSPVVSSPLYVRPAPVQVVSVWTAADAEHPGEWVNARIRNRGSVPLGRYDVIGVLGFGPGANPNDMLHYQHLVLTNGPDNPIQPGKEGVWSFRPVGLTTRELSNQVPPHLWFLQADKASRVSSGAPWKPVSTLAIRNLRLTSGPTAKQARVYGVLVNRSGTKVSLAGKWAIVWLAPRDVSDWTSPRALRFITTLTWATGGAKSLAGGTALAVYFPLLGSETDYRQLVPHMVLVQSSEG
ncbi:MAG: hypothetical protein K6T63_07160 [Alicyclobacillus herbarius]|uniref:hypothetical protein n=1 Tax=Alicyclobacillus herbarius TaxID=122960 RepID=UPI0023523531|nr:hypothetical protein [Alicyclobacillus herbarius]MCL6632398.1 hypothetical protein [Alicyclobacillus herbarius]